MRRIFVMLAAALALATVGVAAAAASTADESDGTPPAATDESTTTTPTTTTDQSNVALQIAAIVQSGSVVYICIINDSPGATCGDAIQVNQANLYQYIYQCNTTSPDSCIIVNVVAPAPSAAAGAGGSDGGPNHVFLCYSDSQIDPGVYTVDQAPGLIAEGYWVPAAMWGTGFKATNIGNFRLVCNTAGDVSVTGDVVDVDGYHVPQAVIGSTLGYYPVVGG